MTLPTCTVEIAFSRPTDPATWTDVTAYVREVTIRRGRQFELDRVETGHCEVKLDNRDRRFDPMHTGPYYPNVKPTRRIRVKATWSGTTYYLFAGYIESWPSEWPGMVDAIVSVTALDGFSLLAQAKVTVSLPVQATRDRVNQVLSEAAWTLGNCWVLGSDTGGVLGTTTVLAPNGDRLLDTGLATVDAADLDSVEALSHLHEVELVERGICYVDGQGRFVFRNRHWLVDTVTSLATFGDAAGELPYAGLEPSYGIERVINEANVSANDGTKASVSDATSKFDHFRRNKDEQSLPIGANTAMETQAMATWLVRRYKAPQLRFHSIEPMGMRDSSIWPHALGADLGYRITVKRRPPGGGAAIVQDCHVESIQHRIKPEEWHVVWELSPADPVVYWKLADANRGQLGISAILAYAFPLFFWVGHLALSATSMLS